MERVAFLLASTNQRVHCLLNPESLLIQRRAGVRSAQLGELPINDASASDDPIISSGGGSTALTLDLLFDIDLQKMQQDLHDVRQLSDPLWQLCETQHQQAPLLRMIWGKSWNIPGVISAGAQRFDRFLNNGTPQRNWMRLRFLRVSEKQAAQLSHAQISPRPRIATSAGTGTTTAAGAAASASTTRTAADQSKNPKHASDYISGERLDLIAAKYLGDPQRWREIAAYNNLEDPLAVGEHDILRLPRHLDSKAER